MKLKFYSVAAVAAFLLAIVGNTKVYTNSTVPPPGRTGDPVNTSTCASGSGCHGTNVLNGDNVVGLKIGSTLGAQVAATSSFVPAANTEYFMTVDLNGTGQKYGFSVSALTSANQQAGSFTITNTNKTMSNPAGGISYVTHKNADATKSWIYKWTSPATISGPISFHVIANIADGNGSESGDGIYKRVVTINGSTSVNDITTLTNFSVYPNPASDNFTLNYNLLSNENVSAQVMTTDGKVVKNLFSERQNLGVVSSNYNISDLAAGKYFIHVTAGGKSTVKPFVKY